MNDPQADSSLARTGDLVAALALPHVRGPQRGELLLALLAMHYLPVLRDALARLLARVGETASDPAALRAMLPVVADVLGGAGLVAPDYRAAVDDVMRGPPPGADPFQWAGDNFGRMMRGAFPEVARSAAGVKVPMHGAPSRAPCEIPGCDGQCGSPVPSRVGRAAEGELFVDPRSLGFLPFACLPTGGIDREAGVVTTDVLLGDGFVPGSLTVTVQRRSVRLAADFRVRGVVRHFEQVFANPASRFDLDAKPGAALTVKVCARDGERIATLVQPVDFGAAVAVEGDAPEPAAAKGAEDPCADFGRELRAAMRDAERSPSDGLVDGLTGLDAMRPNEAAVVRDVTEKLTDDILAANGIDDVLVAVRGARERIEKGMEGLGRTPQGEAAVSHMALEAIAERVLAAFEDVSEHGMNRADVEREVAEEFASLFLDTVEDGVRSADDAAKITRELADALRAAPTLNAWIEGIAHASSRLLRDKPVLREDMRHVIEREVLDDAAINARAVMPAKDALDLVERTRAELRAVDTPEAWIAVIASVYKPAKEPAPTAGATPNAEVPAKLGEALSRSLVDAWEARLVDNPAALRCFVEGALARAFGAGLDQPDEVLAGVLAGGLFAALCATETPAAWFNALTTHLCRATATEFPGDEGDGVRLAMEHALLKGYSMFLGESDLTGIVSDFRARFRAAPTVEAWLGAGIGLVGACLKEGSAKPITAESLEAALADVLAAGKEPS